MENAADFPIRKARNAKIGEKPPFWEAGRARSEPSPYDAFPSVSAAAAPFWGGGFF